MNIDENRSYGGEGGGGFSYPHGHPAAAREEDPTCTEPQELESPPGQKEP